MWDEGIQRSWSHPCMPHLLEPDTYSLAASVASSLLAKIIFLNLTFCFTVTEKLSFSSPIHLKQQFSKEARC